MLHAASRATRSPHRRRCHRCRCLRAGDPGAEERASAPNYELASAWTSQKVSKLVFDTSVTPRWLETSDRFWYAYQTRDGRRFHLVDPVKRTKGALFDHAKMAAALTTITRIPYDAQHLPFTQVRFIKGDSAFEFEVQVPRDAEHPDDQAEADHHRRSRTRTRRGSDELRTRRKRHGRRPAAAGAARPAAPAPARHPTRGRKRSTSNTTWRRRRCR